MPHCGIGARQPAQPQWMALFDPRARMRSEGLLLSVGRWVGLWVCLSARLRTVAAVDTKRGVCNGRSAQQESGTS